jgi:type VI secretion system protein ImpF
MAELTPQERLQPSLLDRLTDEEPGRAMESRESRILSPARLRESVRRDLTWLFNTTHMQALFRLDEVPSVARSVLNFGVPALAGRTLSGLDTAALTRMIHQAILDYEPRLISHSVQVRLAEEDHQAKHNDLVFHVEADLWAQPLPLSLFLRTAIDLETGSVEVSDQEGRGRA